jgi:peptide/nickel transport system substrate-binding protein
MIGGAAVAGGALAARASFATGVVQAQEGTPVADMPKGGTIRMAFQTPATLNPLFSTAGVDQGTERQIYGALVMMTWRTGPSLDLAAAIDVAPDALTYTFTLQDGLMFNDGVPLTSDDVLFTFHTALDPRTGSFWRSRFMNLQEAELYDGEAVTEIAGITAPDEKTIVHSLILPDATWLNTLGDFAGFCIVPKHVFGEIAPQDLQDSALSLAPGPGAGAFSFGEYQADQFISLLRNDNYVPPKANIDQLLLNILPQTVTAMSQLQANEIDILSVAIPDMGLVTENPNLTLTAEPSVMSMFMVPNSFRPVFADKRVRQAMMYGIDRASIASEVFQGYAEVLNAPYFGWEWEEGDFADLNPYAYDPDKARSLLEEADWASGGFAPLMHYIPGDPFNESLHNIVQQQLADIGINVELVQVDVTEYTNRIISGAVNGEPGDFDLLIGSGGVMGSDPNVTARYFDTASMTPFGANYSHFSNARVDELLIAGRGTTDVAERKTIYKEIAKILNEEAVWVYMFRLYAIYGINNRVKNFTPPGHPGRLISSAHEWYVEE